MDGKFLGKIDYASFGIDDDNFLGIHITFRYDGYGVSTINAFKITPDIDDAVCGKVMSKIAKTLNDAKVSTVDGLIGIPVEVEIKGNTLRNWRILTEVL